MSWRRTLPDTRLVFSWRSLDYSAPLSSRERPVPQVRIEPLSDDQVQEFVRLYRPEYGDALWQNLRGTRQPELFRSPYYLKLLVQQSTDGHIPRGRAALFTGFIWHALRREVENDQPLFRPDMLVARDRQRLAQYGQARQQCSPERGLLIPGLSTLAREIQQRGMGTEGTQVRVAYDDALAILGSILDHLRAEDIHSRAKDILKAGAALAVVEQDLLHAKVLFVHQLLQEYFAARRLERESDPSLGQQAWRATEVEEDLQSTLQALPDSEPLPPLPSTG